MHHHSLLFLIFPFVYCVCWQAHYYVHLFFRAFFSCPTLGISMKKIEMSITSFLVKFDLKFWILSSTKSQVYQKCSLVIVCSGGFFVSLIITLIKCLIPTKWQMFLFVLTFFPLLTFRALLPSTSTTFCDLVVGALSLQEWLWSRCLQHYLILSLAYFICTSSM